jgi:hypothetical protein
MEFKSRRQADRDDIVAFGPWFGRKCQVGM